MLGYLFVRGGVHAHAYALALAQLTGVEMKRMLPIPKIENVPPPESKKWEQNGNHRTLYRFSPDDCKSVAAVWHGTALDGSGPLEVVDGPPEGGKLAELDGAGDAFTPKYHPEEIFEMAQRLYRAAR
jgi:Mn-containing catalase